MLITYEREKIVDFIGSQESKINFLQKFNRVAYFDKSYSQFFSAGVYQLEDGPPIIVLPWFLKSSSKILSDQTILKSDLNFFDVIKEIKNFTEAAVDLQKENNQSYALDIVVHSYLINLKNVVRNLVSFNYHEDITEKTNVIKGKWDVPKDLHRGGKPVKFTCTYNSLEVNTPLFLFIKSFCKHLSTLLRSQKNLGCIDEILLLLRDVEHVQLNRLVIYNAYSWIKSHRDKEALTSVIEFAESLVLDQSIYSKQAGVSYQFQMDKFFERLVFNFLKIKSDLTVLPQTREDLLGGALWRSIDEKFSYELESKKATQVTIPDIVVFDQTKYLIFECKYKPLRVPFINSEDMSQDLSTFSREDRNQLLSFIMSIRPSPELRNKKIGFVLIFPCSYIEKCKISELHFESAKLHVDPVVRNLIQNRIKVEDGSGLSIKFLGVSIPFMIEAVLSKDVASVADIVALATSSETVTSLSSGESKFEKLVQKRVALAGMIVNSGKNDPSLGRVKLAKVFYLADAHLKLGMEAQYLRETAGPLDQRLLYNDRWGIESQGIKHSFYRRVENRNGNRYVPGTNIDNVIRRANSLFVDKLENIKSLINILAPLNTERAEIVTTLYACWNDLLSRNSSVTDDEVINDFHNNWHPSKNRFAKETLLIALKWMKEKGLIPDGSGPTCQAKQEKLPSGF